MRESTGSQRKQQKGTQRRKAKSRALIGKELIRKKQRRKQRKGTK